MQIIEPKPGTSSVLHNPSIDDKEDKSVLDTLLIIQEGWHFNPKYIGTSLSHPYTFQVMKSNTRIYSVLHNPKFDDIKDRRALDTLTVILNSLT